RRRRHEQAAAANAKSQTSDDWSWREVQRVLHEELERLPVKYRQALLLCCLEGRTRDEAARQLGWTVGMLKGMLDRGRDLLCRRLERRGVTLAAALATATLTQDATAVSHAATARAALAFASGRAGASPGAALAEAMLRSGHAHTFYAAALVLLAGVVTAGA